MGTTLTPCGHDGLFILPVEVNSNERLLLSCWLCHTIWFYDIKSKKFNVTLKKEAFYPEFMFKAEGDYVYIINRVKGPNPIVKVKCSPTELTVDMIKTIQCRIDKFSSMCYLPDVKCIAVSHWSDHVVKAIHCETGEEIWKLKGR